MEQVNMQPPEATNTVESSAVILSPSNNGDLVTVPAAAELATMRHMMETLFARVEALQQNQAVQFAGVHDRLDAVELELPLIQEQSALRMRDLEARLANEIEEATRNAMEAAAAGIQTEVADKLGSLTAIIESQEKELAQMREAKQVSEARLNRAVLDIERLCGNLSVPQHQAVPTVHTSPARSRIAEHIRRAAVDAAPDSSNPLIADPVARPIRRAETVEPAAAPATPPAAPPAAAVVKPEPAPKPVSDDRNIPGFQDWKRKFMQDGEPLTPTLHHDSGIGAGSVICPRCYSERTRPASAHRLDGLYRIFRYSPHRCRSCGYRFYRQGIPAANPGSTADSNGTASGVDGNSGQETALEIR